MRSAPLIIPRQLLVCLNAAWQVRKAVGGRVAMRSTDRPLTTPPVYKESYAAAFVILPHLESQARSTGDIQRLPKL